MKKTMLMILLLLTLAASAYAEDSVIVQESGYTDITSNDNPQEQENTQVSENTVQEENTAPPKQVDLYINDTGVTLSNFPIIENNSLMLPLSELLYNMKIYDFSVDSENQITVTYGSKIIAMHIDSDTAYLNGNPVTLQAKAVLINDTVYAPMRTVCEYFGFTVTAYCTPNLMTVRVNDKSAEKTPSSYVNSAGLSSKTPYLIWVNKEKYTVYVFLGSEGNWEQVYSCKCAIGADKTPTITGTYKFYSLEERWEYDDFYVGPIMRFRGGYAIHSTLLKYDGTNYNATVGKKLSHGCVRVRPADMNWLVSYVPLQTTIHITEK